MLKKFLLVIMCVFLVDAKVDVKKVKGPTSQYIESNTTLMKAGDVKFGVGAIAGAFSTTNATVGTEMLTVDVWTLTSNTAERMIYDGERARRRMKNANDFAPGGELFVRYMLTGNGFMALNASWQHGSKKLKFRDSIQSDKVSCDGPAQVIDAIQAFHEKVAAKYPKVAEAVIGIPEGFISALDEGPLGYAKLRGYGLLTLDLGYFVGPRVALIGNVGLALHSIKFSLDGVKSSSKTATGLVVGGGVELFVNRHLAIMANAGYMYTRKKIESLQNKVRGVNFSAKVRYYV